MPNTDTRISKSLSYWLRHAPEAAGLTLDQAGWAELDAVLRALDRAGLPHDHETLGRVVAESEKQRFELSVDGARIRARQGHSVAVDAEWPVAPPPAVLYHGTVERSLAAILSEGLKPLARHHVHLSPDIATAQNVGRRRGPPVVLAVDAAGLTAAGHEFRLSSNGVWLIDHVPPQFLRRT